MRTHLNDLFLTWLHLQRPYFQIRLQTQVLGLGIQPIFLDGTIHPIPIIIRISYYYRTNFIVCFFKLRLWGLDFKAAIQLGRNHFRTQFKSFWVLVKSTLQIHCPNRAKHALKLCLRHWKYHYFYASNICIIPLVIYSESHTVRL